MKYARQQKVRMKKSILKISFLSKGDVGSPRKYSDIFEKAAMVSILTPSKTLENDVVLVNILRTCLFYLS